MKKSASTTPHRVLAVASGGGHWVQLRRMRPAWEGCAVTYVTTLEGYRAEIEAEAAESTGPASRFEVVPDANRWQKVRLVRQLLALLWIVLRTRPHAIVTTGAAPGYFAIRLGRLLGARTVWIDSIANAEELSLSGRKVGRHAHLFLTQWEHLAENGSGQAAPQFHGTVL
ncbi:MAG: UDP-N-acetylglucosamine--LPS N-acetylglucosamine transferase [Pseudomonadota bacterium]